MIATTARALTGAVPMPEHCVLVGAALGPRRTDPSFRWDWWDPGRRHVLVTAGTLSDHLVHDFISADDGGAGADGAPGCKQCSIPPRMRCRIRRHTSWSPRGSRCSISCRALDAVVCSGGQSTVNEALVHGVPMVVAPIRLGELAVAEQVTRAGAGIAVSFPEATPAQLAAAVTAVLDEPGYRAQARRIGEEFAAAGGAGAAAAHLAALAAGRWR